MYISPSSILPNHTLRDWRPLQRAWVKGGRVCYNKVSLVRTHTHAHAQGRITKSLCHISLINPLPTYNKTNVQINVLLCIFTTWRRELFVGVGGIGCRIRCGGTEVFILTRVAHLKDGGAHTTHLEEERSTPVRCPRKTGVARATFHRRTNV